MVNCSLALLPQASPGQNVLPTFCEKFKSQPVNSILQEVLQDKCKDAEYNTEQFPLLLRQIANEARDRLKALEMPRYKVIVNVMGGELRGQGIKMGRRCFWDESTDSVASEAFVNEKFYCVITAYAVYVY